MVWFFIVLKLQLFLEWITNIPESGRIARGSCCHFSALTAAFGAQQNERSCTKGHHRKAALKPWGGSDNKFSYTSTFVSTSFYKPPSRRRFKYQINNNRTRLVSHGGQIDMMHSNAPWKTLNQHHSKRYYLTYSTFNPHQSSHIEWFKRTLVNIWHLASSSSVFWLHIRAWNPPRVSSTAGFCWLWKSHKVSDLSCKQPPITLVTFLHPGKPSLTSKQTEQGRWKPITAI